MLKAEYPLENNEMTLPHLGFKFITAGWFFITVQYMRESIRNQHEQMRMIKEYIKNESFTSQEKSL